MKTSSAYLSLIGAVLVLATACNASPVTEDKRTMNVLVDKPFFQLNIHFFGASNIIKVNGVSVLRTYESGGQLTTTLPINHWMRSGENTLAVLVLPRQPGESFNPNAVVKAELVVSSANPGSPTYKIADIDFKAGLLEESRAVESSSPAGTFDAAAGFAPAPRGNVKVSEVKVEPVGARYEGAYYITRELHIPSSLPLWAFFNSDTVPDHLKLNKEDYAANFDEMFAVYEKVQAALASGDIDSIMPLFEERSREIDQAFYLPEGHTQARLRASMLEAVNDPDKELAELTPKNVGIRREDNGKLVSLLRRGDRNAVGFNVKSYGGSHSYPIMLRREKGKWIITR